MPIALIADADGELREAIVSPWRAMAKSRTSTVHEL